MPDLESDIARTLVALMNAWTQDVLVEQIADQLRIARQEGIECGLARRELAGTR